MTTEDRLVSFLGKPVSESSSTEIYEALLQLVKEEAEKLYQGFFAEVMKSIQNLNKWYKTLPW